MALCWPLFHRFWRICILRGDHNLQPSEGGKQKFDSNSSILTFLRSLLIFSGGNKTLAICKGDEFPQRSGLNTFFTPTASIKKLNTSTRPSQHLLIYLIFDNFIFRNTLVSNVRKLSNLHIFQKTSKVPA